MNGRPKPGRCLNVGPSGCSPQVLSEGRGSIIPCTRAPAGGGTPYTAPSLLEPSDFSRADARMKSPPRDFGILGFDHVDLRVTNRPKIARFFAEQLGMDVIGEGPDHTYLLFGDQVLGLRDPKEGEK